MRGRAIIGVSISRREVKHTKKPQYKRAYCAKILDYFSQPPQRVEKKVAYYPDGGVKSEEPVVLPAPLPTFQAFAEDAGVSVSELRRWRKEHPEFDAACERAQQMQENAWLVNSLAGCYNSSFAQFFGKTVLGYGEREAGEEEPPVITVRVVD